MTPESSAWIALERHAYARLRPGFAQRALRAARHAGPSLARQCVVSMAAAAACLTVVFAVHQRENRQEEARALAYWQQIADQVAHLEYIP